MVGPIPGREFFLVIHNIGSWIVPFISISTIYRMAFNRFATYLRMAHSCFQNVQLFKKSETELNKYLAITKKWTFQ